VRALTWTTRSSSVSGYVDFLLGYQYWQERYLAFGATGFPGTVPSDAIIVVDTGDQNTANSTKAAAHRVFPLHASSWIPKPTPEL
jgi:hypothetical protein